MLQDLQIVNPHRAERRHADALPLPAASCVRDLRVEVVAHRVGRLYVVELLAQDELDLLVGDVLEAMSWQRHVEPNVVALANTKETVHFNARFERCTTDTHLLIR